MMIQAMIQKMKENCALKVLRDLNNFFKIKVKRDCGGMHLCQVNYIQDVLTRTNIVDCK